MPLRFLLDENQRGVLWHVIQRHNARGIDVLDAVRVGDVPDLPLGSPDGAILVWAEREERILVSFDRSSLSRHLAEHLAAGHHCPGIFLVLTDAKPPDVLDFLILAAYASDPAEWKDWINHVQNGRT
ncbi:MAG: DUF5615 family PIN-like protein [Gemmataceae bacterium]